jgi:diamine N-acetyltransferase
MIELRDVTQDNLKAVLSLEVAPDQQDLVAPNAVSIAEAYFEPRAWFRAVYADDAPVEFVMLLDNVEERWVYVWRMMIDARHQRMGYGSQAMRQIIDRVRTMGGITHIFLSHVDRQDSAGPFYRNLGFCETGDIDHGEVVMALVLNGQAS